MIENAAHVRDIERVYQERFSKMAFSDRPAFAFWMLDNDRAAAQLKYAESDPQAVAKEFRRLREDTLAAPARAARRGLAAHGASPEAR